MINSGVPDTIVGFWLGHSIGEMAEAYKSVQAGSLKRRGFFQSFGDSIQRYQN